VFEGRAHFGFGIDAQCVGHAIDVIEIGDDFHSVQDVAIIEAVLTKGIDVMFPDGRGLSRGEIGKFCQGLASRWELCVQIILLGFFGQLCVAAFRTEILPVSFCSIETIVGS